MPNFPRTYRVSIVIPLQRDEKLFEETLLSVLENRCDDCQVIVAHNGTYTDPFQLSDEVDFVVARSSNLVDLIRDAFPVTAAPIVHVLGTGRRVRGEWLTGAIERFSDGDIGAVTPALVDQQARSIDGALWSDTAGRLCQSQIQLPTTASLAGFYLDTCFIRRRLLGSLLDAIAPAMNDAVAVSYAMGCLLKRSGWKLVLATDSTVESNRGSRSVDQSDSDRGKCLGAIRARVLPGEAKLSTIAMLRAAIFGTSSFAEMLGMMRHQSGIAAMRRSIDPEAVVTAGASLRGGEVTTLHPQARREAA